MNTCRSKFSEAFNHLVQVPLKFHPQLICGHLKTVEFPDAELASVLAVLVVEAHNLEEVQNDIRHEISI